MANKLRSNRAKLLKALPHALWQTKESHKMRAKISEKNCAVCNDIKAGNALTVCFMHDIYWPIREDTMDHYLAIAMKEPDKVSFAVKPAYKQDEPRRTQLTFARYVRRQLGITEAQLPDDVLAAMQTRLIAATRTDFADDEIRILVGEDLRAAYKSAIGHTSCMTGAERQHLLDLYVANPDRVGLLVFEPVKGTKYRALLWTLDDGWRYMDRIYPADGSAHVSALMRWAAANKTRVYGSLSGKPCPIVSLPNGQQKFYPYLDSFRYGRWMDTKKTGITLRTAEGTPQMKDSLRHKDWPLYFGENQILDINNRPVPCHTCQRPFDKANLMEGPDGCLHCAACYEKNYTVCTCCNTRQWHTEMTSACSTASETGRVPLCNTCLKANTTPCKWCLEDWVSTLLVKESGMCPYCDAHVKATGQVA